MVPLMCFRKDREAAAGGLECASADAPGSSASRVETYSGYRLHEQPRHFIFRGERLEVARILSQWREPENLSFIVIGNDACQYVLKYFPLRDAWEVRLGRRADPRPG